MSDPSEFYVQGDKILDRLTKERDQLRAELDAAKRRSVALEEAGEMLWVCLANVDQGNWASQTEEWQKAAAEWRDRYYKAVRSPNAGSDLLTKEQVRPLVEALKWCWDESHITGNYGCVGKALEHAKSLGL